MTLGDLAALRRQITRHEGVRLKPYRCTAGKLTIGIGRNLEDRGITAEEAAMLLDNDITETIGALSQRFDWFDELSPVRQMVLVDMCFNLGMGGLLKFKRFLGAVSRHEYEAAAQEMLASKWAKQVGQRALRLATMLESGLLCQ